MKFWRLSLLSGLAAVGVAAASWAFCEKEKGSASGASATTASATEQSPSASPCPHAGVEKSAIPTSGTAEKPSGCCKKGKAGLASDSTGGCSKNCRLAKKSADDRSEPCPIEAVLTSLPAMKYRVGTEETGCSKSAEEMAVKANAPIKYVVGETVYENKNEATAALTKLLDAEIENLTAVQYAVNGKCSKCPLEARKIAEAEKAELAYKVGGLECKDKAKAELAASKIKEALAEVKLTYKVGDEKFCCDKMAGAKAKETGKTITFVVGEEETCCEQSAKLLLTQAKIHAIVAAAAAAILAS
jgi:hypothetical protein